MGYYESWSYDRTCDAWAPETIDATAWTHLFYAFALIDSSTFKISQMNSFDIGLYTRFTALKQQNPSLKVFISVGGWSAGGAIFSNMVSSSSSRSAFITSAVTFLKTYAFDGIDIDWEYPAATDRDGVAADTDNYVTFLKELSDAFGTKYGISATLPSSYWYMQGFDVSGMAQYLDFINLMTYDIHGTWDGDNAYTSKVVQPHTNLTEIGEALDLLWRNSIDSSKVNLGLGFYGRSFTLADPTCNIPGCAFSGGGNAGDCTATSGILSNAEIQRIISANNLSPTLDKTAAVKYMSWDSDQWVSYDDSETYALKLEYANQLCLGGTFVWALDLDDPTNTTSTDDLSSGASSISISEKITTGIKKTTTVDNGATLGIFWTPCLPPNSQTCPAGYNVIANGHGKVFDADLNHITGGGCHGGGDIPKRYNRALCAPNNVDASTCQWGPTTKGKACNSKCPTGWITLTKNSHVGGQKGGCKSGKYAPICCQSVTAQTDSKQCYATTADHIFSGSLASRTDTSGITSYSYDSDDDDDYDDDISSDSKKAKIKRSSEKSHGLSKRGLGSWAGSCAESVTLPLGAIPIDVPAGLLQSYAGLGTYQVELEPITVSVSSSKKPRKTITIHSQVESTSYDRITTRTCDGSRFPQPCFNYRSIAENHAVYANPTCANVQKSVDKRPLPRLWNKQHATNAWISWNPKSYTDPDGDYTSVRPQRDEWPPAHFMQGVASGYVRLLPGTQNGKVANDGVSGWKGFCKYPPEKEVKTEGGPVVVIGDIVYETVYTSTITTLKVLNYEYTNMPVIAGDPHGLTANSGGWPETLTDDPGFALLANDPYYAQPALWPYSKAPSAAIIKGKTKPKRDNIWFDEDLLAGVVDVGNSSRRATEDEMFEELGILQCEEDCEEEKEALERMGLLALIDEAALVSSSISSSPAAAVAVTTTAVSVDTVATQLAAPASFATSSWPSLQSASPSAENDNGQAGLQSTRLAKRKRHLQVHRESHRNSKNHAHGSH